MSLAALTATYTDSEDEEERVTKVEEPSPDSNTNDSVTIPRSHPSRLVSYGEPDENDEDRLDSSLNVTDELMEPVDKDTIVKVFEVENSSANAANNQNDDDDISVVLPPEPRGECSPEASSAQHWDGTRHIKERQTLSSSTYKSKSGEMDTKADECILKVRGPMLFNIELFNPHLWEKKSYYEELGKVQKALMEKREKEKKAKVEFVSGTAKRQNTEPIGDDSKKRKSKWDVGSGPAPAAAHPKPEVSAFVPLASGNKSTVIPAFGSFVKKK
ncbi:SAP30-binding protein [Nymphon striatum]|nr:SAP30-binding protein [Nymphon striatum]